MPHSSRKNVDAPMDAWDRQRCGLALLEIRQHLALLGFHVGALRDEGSREEISGGLERVTDAIRRFVDESE